MNQKKTHTQINIIKWYDENRGGSERDRDRMKRNKKYTNRMDSTRKEKAQRTTSHIVQKMAIIFS